VREALLAYEHQLKDEARADYTQALLRHVVLAPWVKDAKPPKVPRILED
jgi:hypothetical protein